MVKVRMKTLDCSPEGNVFPGDTIEVTNNKAKELVKGGFGVYVEKPRKKPGPKPKETASMETPENTMMPYKPKKKKS